MRRCMALVVVLGVSACGYFGAVTIDYVDFVKWRGIDYSAPHSGAGRPISDADLGPAYFVVTQTVATAGRGPGYQIQDGDAAFVRSGEPVYTVHGYAPTFRLAARHDGRLVLYEAQVVPGARIGRDLLDIDGKVSAIAILDQRRQATVIGRISDPARVEALVRMVLDGRVERSQRSPGSGADASGSFATVSFELRDGTATVRGYDLGTNTLSSNVVVAAGFGDAIRALVASAPTPTPAPASVNLTRRYDLAHARSLMIKRPDRRGAQPVQNAAEWSAALDADAPAVRAADPSRIGDIVVIFSFPDRYVSLVYDRTTGMIHVAVPADELDVEAPAAFRTLLDR